VNSKILLYKVKDNNSDYYEIINLRKLNEFIKNANSSEIDIAEIDQDLIAKPEKRTRKAKQ
jgi:hypothetical protein